MTTTPTDPTDLSTADLRGGLPGERGDLLESLRLHRGFLRHTLTGLTEEQARSRPTVSALSVGGVVKHVSLTEAQWAKYVVGGPDVYPDVDFDAIDWSNPPPEVVEFQQQFQLGDDETVEGVLAAYEAVAAATDELVRTADLDHVWPLPRAPWFAPDGTRSVRRVLLGLIGETAQHAGHADILRETIDGQTTMS